MHTERIRWIGLNGKRESLLSFPSVLLFSILQSGLRMLWKAFRVGTLGLDHPPRSPCFCSIRWLRANPGWTAVRHLSKWIWQGLHTDDPRCSVRGQQGVGSGARSELGTNQCGAARRRCSPDAPKPQKAVLGVSHGGTTHIL